MVELLLLILVATVLARLGGELMERVGQLALLGEILAGVLLGAFITYGFPQFVEPVHAEAFHAVSSLGMFFLMLMAGMEIDAKELAKVSKKGALVAVGGVLIPMGLGYLLGQLLIPESEYRFVQSFLLGVVLSITAVPALTRVLGELGQLDTKLGNVIINAAVIDDVLALFLLAILTPMISGGGLPSAGELSLLAAKVVGFFGVAIITGKFLMPLIGRLSLKSRYVEIEFSVALIIALTFGIGAEYAGMHFIIGALVAGLFLQENTFGENYKALENKISGVTLGFLAPIFFVSIGLNVDLSALGTAPLFVITLIAVAIVGKLLGCGIPAKLSGFSIRESLAIGIGMNGRGAVEIIVATIALNSGIFSKPEPTPTLVSALFSSIVIMAVVTTVIVPLGMKPLLRGSSTVKPLSD
ncbi:cation:proton antiporter [Chloroflexota bacterium]